MENPFSKSNYLDETDSALIALALKGDKSALNDLLSRHQNFIYNIALKMLNDVPDAQDATQEILIKLLTSLSKFDGSKARFRTWLYRITFNHVLNIKKSPYEKIELNFSKFFAYMDVVPDIAVNNEEEQELQETIEEAKISCTAGMLMCLSREQRLTYIVGEIFEIDHHLASEIFEISADNFRQRLSRARKDLHEWMHNRCGLVNLDNPCRCKSKTKAFIERGVVNPDNKKWLSGYKNRIFELSEQNLDSLLNDRDKIYQNIYKQHPLKLTDKAEHVISEIMNARNFSDFFDLKRDKKEKCR